MTRLGRQWLRSGSLNLAPSPPANGAIWGGGSRRRPAVSCGWLSQLADEEKPTKAGTSGFAGVFRPEVSYSALRAMTGEMEAARVAGIMAAKNAHRARAIAAKLRANGSQLETP